MSSAGGARRIGFFGGTFDPIHNGHLRFAQQAQAKHVLDEIVFVAAERPWHKRQPLASYVDRHAMVALAVQEQVRWTALSMPAEACGASPSTYTYSVDQLACLQERDPGARIFFLIGADSMLQIHTWHASERLLSMCDFIVAPRAGAGAAEIARSLPPRLVRSFERDSVTTEHSKIFVLTGFNEAVSSTRLREALQSGDASPELVDWVPAPVLRYASRAGFYRSPTPAVPRGRGDVREVR